MLQFKDKEKYQSFNYPLLLSELAPIDVNGEKRRVVEFQNVNSPYYHLLMPLERDLKAAEQNNDRYFLNHWSKYRSGQKRRDYSDAEFNELFEVINAN